MNHSATSMCSRASWLSSKCISAKKIAQTLHNSTYSNSITYFMARRNSYKLSLNQSLKWWQIYPAPYTCVRTFYKLFHFFSSFFQCLFTILSQLFQIKSWCIKPGKAYLFYISKFVHHLSVGCLCCTLQWLAMDGLVRKSSPQ